MNLRTIRDHPVAAALALIAVTTIALGVNAALHAGHTTPAAPAVSPAATNGPSGVAATEPTPDGHSTTSPTPSPAIADDGADEAPSAATALPAQLAAAQDVAERFTAAWLNTTNKGPAEWRADLAGYITPELADGLATADPATVPVGQIGAPVTVTPDGDHLAHITVPITTGGTLTVTVVLGAQPLVSDVDWTAKP